MVIIAWILAMAVTGVSAVEHVPAAEVGGLFAPPRVLLLGDSNISASLGHELERALADRGIDVVRHARSVSGMARPDFFDWRSQGEQLVRELDPDVVIMMFGGNDGQGLVPWGPLRRPIKWQDEDAWRSEYHRRVQELAQVLVSGGRRLFLLSPTNRRPRGLQRRMRRVIEVQREAVAQVDRAVFIDTFALSSTADGECLAKGPDSRGRIVPYRTNDGIHLTRAGAADLTERLLPALLGPDQRRSPGS
jgi:hypothetical protein